MYFATSVSAVPILRTVYYVHLVEKKRIPSSICDKIPDTGLLCSYILILELSWLPCVRFHFLIFTYQRLFGIYISVKPKQVLNK